MSESMSSSVKRASSTSVVAGLEVGSGRGSMSDDEASWIAVDIVGCFID